LKRGLTLSASVIYRAKFLDCLAASGLADQAGQAVGDKPWVVHSKLVKCEPGPDGLGRVTFTYRKSGSCRWRTMTVTADEYIRRFLQHVLPTGFQKVRHYGFAHPRRGIDIEWLQMLVTTTLTLV
jgi:hypothetical protein